MTDQLDINGNSVPLTWDGEPVYSPETVREGLFDREAFIQLRGQTSYILTRCHCCRQDFLADRPMESYCAECLELGS